MSTNETPIRILLVADDQEASRLRELLEVNQDSAFCLSEVSNLDQAAELLSGEEADILLADMGSNHLAGRAFVEAARAAAPEMPIVILSEAAENDLALESLRQGVQDFLSKADLQGATLMRSLRYAMERHGLQKTLRSLSLTDDLTGLQNRRGFLALAGQHLRIILRKGAASLVYLDLDDLKVINDTYGHLEGNRALVVTANVLRACFRQSDILARIGGDEFCVLMTDAGEDSAHHVRKRLQQRLDSINASSSLRFRLSLSVGIAEVSGTNLLSLEELIRFADANMYEEKRSKTQPGPFRPGQTDQHAHSRPRMQRTPAGD